ncbi:hypothetical protein [Desulfobacula sp.]|uniref:GNAT family N-acetyltransferase n=1 Tax=Desulfobacula sp. TaxID=2593537 RepID=UPI00260AC09C|nr:hypothetical protein [Desulfobacula sp.]
MKITLLPYTEIDGIRTIPDSDMKKFYDRTVKDGTDKTVFYEGTISNRDEFLSVMKSPGVLFYVVMIGTEPVGFTWLNRFENHTARNHFCGFSEVWGQAVGIGKEVISTLIHMKDNDGKFIFDLFTGFIPGWNQYAIKFCLQCGAKSAGIIPNAIWNKEKQKSEDAFFIYYTRGEK